MMTNENWTLLILTISSVIDTFINVLEHWK